MIEIHKAKQGTPHYVRIVDRRREFFKGETMENTAPLFQYGLQRQKLVNEAFEDADLDIFSMSEGTFEDCYEPIDKS